MRRKILTAVTAIALAAILTACTQADSDNSSTAESSVSLEQNGTLTAENLAGGALIRGDAVSGNTSDAGALSSAENAEYRPETSNPGQTGGTGSTEAVRDEENYEDDEPDAVNEDETDGADEGWAGSYVCDSGEKLTISIDEADSIQFAFDNAGISGKAELNENQAVYHGDDYHVVVFDRNGDEIEVSVLSEEDYDTSGSPLIGSYIRK